MCGSLCACVILSQDLPVIQQWSPLYVMISVIVVMSEKVDTTITKGDSCTNPGNPRIDTCICAHVLGPCSDWAQVSTAMPSLEACEVHMTE